jgi:Zn-dependent peptidase ImmA (M78 family)
MEERRRFTIGQEFGHFLMTHHHPSDSRFQCTSSQILSFP